MTRTQLPIPQLSSAQIREARSWLLDCFGESPNNWADIQSAVDATYEGGLRQFNRDTITLG